MKNCQLFLVIFFVVAITVFVDARRFQFENFEDMMELNPEWASMAKRWNSMDDDVKAIYGRFTYEFFVFVFILSFSKHSNQ